MNGNSKMILHKAKVCAKDIYTFEHLFGQEKTLSTF